jgi:hypothetical protein
MGDSKVVIESMVYSMFVEVDRLNVMLVIKTMLQRVMFIFFMIRYCRCMMMSMVKEVIFSQMEVLKWCFVLIIC